MTKSTIIDAQNLVGQVVSGRYEVLDHLGDGSMGIVFLAEHTHMKKKLALKVMREEFLDNPEAIERFEREAQAAGHISHPNVCAASDFGRLDDDRFFLVMEYLEGRTLGDLLDEERRLEPERVVRITRQIAAGLTRAHELDVVHRDLKPDNIILVDTEAEPDFVKITDFGVARVEVVSVQKLTQAGTTMGTPVYMSPEQATATQADARSDLYTLGIMMFEMLTGDVPFYSDSLAVILSKHSSQPPPDMHDVAPDALIPADLVEIVEKLMAKKPEERFQSAPELIAALDDADLSPHVPGLQPDEPSPVDDTPDVPASADVSGADAFSSVEEVPAPPAEPAPLEFPSPDQPTTFSDLTEKFADLPTFVRYGAVAVLLLLLTAPFVGLAIWAIDGDEESADSDGPMAFTEDEVAPPDLADERREFLDDADVAETIANGNAAERIAALEPLLADHADNAHLNYLLGKARMEAEEFDAAMKYYAEALAADERYAADTGILADAASRYSQREDDEARPAEPVLEAMLKSAEAPAAATSVYDVAIEGGWAARKRAKALLERTGQYETLEPWQKSAIDLLLTGKNCERVKKLVVELGESGEPRALPALRKTAKRPSKGCGFLKRADCYECMRADLKKAVSKLEATEASQENIEERAKP